MATQMLPLLTVADLDALPEDDNKYELIAGDLYMSRAPHIHHQLVVTNITGAFFMYLLDNPVGKIVAGPGVIFSEYDAVIPDLIYISNERFAKVVSPEGKLMAAPDLAIEILSMGSENVRRDRVLKRRLYGEYGVSEYWIVDSFTLSVEIYRLQDDGLSLIEKLRVGDAINTPLLPNFSMKVSDIFQF
jgi:Uma2 family endonuclease